MLRVILIGFFLVLSTNIHAIKVSAENKGQVLLAPVYYSTDSFTSNLSVINTRIDAAVVARVVFRDHVSSSVLLEFDLYLSPGDMWTGSISKGNNQAQITSSDDSILNNDAVFATTDSPLNKNLASGGSIEGNNNFGHIEIVGTASFQAGYSYCASDGKLNPSGEESQCTSVKVQQGMTKDDLKKLSDYAATINSLKTDANSNLIYKDIDSDGGGISAVEPEKLQITGVTEIQINSGLIFNYNMIALEPTNYSWGNVGIDIDSSLPKSKQGSSACNASSPYSCFPNYVISNPLFAFSQTQEQGIGENFGTIEASNSFSGDTSDHVIAIEALFARTEVNHAYSKNKTHLITIFPTKYRHKTNTGRGVCYDFYGTSDLDVSGKDLFSSPFFWDGQGNLYYDLTSYNQQEDSTESPGPEIPTAPEGDFSGGTPQELPPVPENDQTISTEIWINTLADKYGYDQGWASLKYLYKDGCGYNGVPSISYILKLQLDQNSISLEKTF